jgi:predicted transcriptional regulator
MSEERKRILKMLAEGKISTSEAEELLDALGKNGDIVKVYCGE